MRVVNQPKTPGQASPAIVTLQGRKPRPLIIRGIERRRIDTDKGVGDTVERIISKLGGDSFKWVMQRLGLDCGCDNRKAWLNARWPYDS